jgi:hypothetical protein
VHGCGGVEHWQVRAVVTDLNATCGGTYISSAATLTTCPADYNCSGAITVQDIFDFLGGWFQGNPSADVDESGTITVQDIFDFLGMWFSGCA